MVEVNVLAVITEIIALTKQLIIVLNQQENNDQTAQQYLIASRDKLLGQLNNALKNHALHANEQQALQALQQLDTELILAKLNNLLVNESEIIEPRYHRAVILAHLGRNTEAQADFLKVLAKQASHYGTLVDFGNLLLNTGYRSAARTLYQQAVDAHPSQSMAYVNLANILVSEADYLAAKKYYQTALSINEHCLEAHQGLSYVLVALGDSETALKHQVLGFQGRPLMVWPYYGNKAPIKLLILCSALGGNIAFKHLLDNKVFAVTLLFTEYFDANSPLPEHQLIINAIGDTDLCLAGLQAAEILLEKSPCQVINPPDRVKHTGRLEHAETLANIPGVITAKSILLSRALLLSSTAEQRLLEQGLQFPLLVRSPGYHTGQHFQCVAAITQLPEIVARLPGEQLLVMAMLNAKNQQGDYHKYRVMFINGKLYPLHYAVSKHWKVHYFTANMAEQVEARYFEQLFLQDMTAVLPERVILALSAIALHLGLDYAGIDFAVNQAGEVLLFEANATMIVPLPESDEMWQYRRHAVEVIQQAVQAMLLECMG